ncbi:MAG TPA: helix-turn-helix transcriptional regulator [Gemmatimonadaceae bacterium]|nr:helix-turn-helix transcriptional regulator [Gemmatimonadaceae bacterium]
MSEVTHAAELLGTRIREMRKKRRLTQVMLAETSGIPQSHMSSIERGAMLPNLVTLFRLAAALNCKVSALVSVFDKEDPATLLAK